MKVTPVIFSAPMIRALFEGRKSQTRRIIKQQPADKGDGTFVFSQFRSVHLSYHWRSSVVPDDFLLSCPYGKPGDLLWVRENVWLPCEASPRELQEGADTWQPDYYADGLTAFDIEQYKQWGWRPTPSIHMPRRVSRLTLELNEVRVQHLQSISEQDAQAEGVAPFRTTGDTRGWYLEGYKANYKLLWESINGRDSWDADPWVWCLSFFVHHQNIDAFLKARAA